MDQRRDSIGEKIRLFRKRSGLSQFALELEINASPGFISRIESNKVNPTKETLIKIIKVLNIKTYEALSLFDLNLEEIPDFFSLLFRISTSFDQNKILQEVTDLLVKELDFIGSASFIVVGERIYARTYSRLWYAKMVDKIIGVPFNSLSLSFANNPNHVLIKTISNNKSYFVPHLADLTSPPLAKRQGYLLHKLVKYKSGIIFPLEYRNKVIGAVFFGRSREDDFSREYSFLKTVSEYAAIAIGNAQVIEQFNSARKAFNE